MVSLPERYFTYSAWMSGRSKAVEDARGRSRTSPADTAPTVSSPTAPPTPTAVDRLRPSLTVLFPIAHPPNSITRVIRDQQGAVCRDEEPDRAPPTRAVGQLPAGHEVLGGGWAPALHADAHDFRARRHAAVPGAVIRHERVALELGRKRRPRIEREAERSRVRLHGQRRGLDAGAVGTRVFRFRIPLAREIALRPTVPLAVLQDVQVFRRQIVAQGIAIVVVGPQLARAGVERQPYRVAESRGEGVGTRPVQVVARHRRPGWRVVADVAGRSDGDVQQIVGPEREGPRAVAAGGQTGDDSHGSDGAGIEPLDRRLRGEIERVPAERDPRGIAQAGEDRNDRVGDAVAVGVHQPDDPPGPRLGRVYGAARTEGEEAHAAHALREDVDGESDGDVQHVTGDRDRVTPEPAPPAARERGPRVASDHHTPDQDESKHRGLLTARPSHIPRGAPSRPAACARGWRAPVPRLARRRPSPPLPRPPAAAVCSLPLSGIPRTARSDLVSPRCGTARRGESRAPRARRGSRGRPCGTSRPRASRAPAPRC